LAQSEGRLDKTICPWDAVKMYEFKEGAEVSKRFYEPDKIKIVASMW
jgi:hypothetical protein